MDEQIRSWLGKLGEVIRRQGVLIFAVLGRSLPISRLENADKVAMNHGNI